MSINEKNYYTQNRELSWLKFNDRVLDEALDSSVPLLERLKFISIFSSNLDEFFMIRVGSLFDIHHVDPEGTDNKSGLTAFEQLDKIYKEVKPLYQKRNIIYNDLRKKLNYQGIYELNYSDLEEIEKQYIKQYFKDTILPILSPQLVDSLHPFPHLLNNEHYIAASLKGKEKNIFALVPIPSMLKDIVFLQGNETRFIRTENIILAMLEKVYKKHEIMERAVIRVTRNADINLEEDNEDTDLFDGGIDFRIKMKQMLRKRKRLSAVRLETSIKLTPELQKYLCANLHLEKYQVFYTNTPMNLSYAFMLASKISVNRRKVLTFNEFKPQDTGDLDNSNSIMKQIMKKDVLLSYPYEKMDPFLKLIKEAANDDSVLSIKITIYRLASKAKLVDYLCRAAENGKAVTVLIELRARFDEQNNIDWSEKLEEAGCNVIYGFENMKVHSKLCLITRVDRGEYKYITVVGTGNFNEKTATMYTDLKLLTYNQSIGKDANEFFKNMGIANIDGVYKHLLVAPNSMKDELFKLIDEQAQLKENGRIVIKCNSITDYDVINKLMEASCIGVKITLIVRGICCILPNVSGKTENIEVRSVVGRYLEHSRIYSFGIGKNNKMYISSADIMTRNLRNRVEVACPIYDENVKNKINHILDLILIDNVKARILQNDGTYCMVEQGENILLNSQHECMVLALETAIKQNIAKEAMPIKQNNLTKLLSIFRKK